VGAGSSWLASTGDGAGKMDKHLEGWATIWKDGRPSRMHQTLSSCSWKDLLTVSSLLGATRNPTKGLLAVAEGCGEQQAA
jgi:hypothetical protein